MVLPGPLNPDLLVATVSRLLVTRDDDREVELPPEHRRRLITEPITGRGEQPERAAAALGGVCALAGRPAGDDLHRAPGSGDAAGRLGDGLPAAADDHRGADCTLSQAGAVLGGSRRGASSPRAVASKAVAALRIARQVIASD